MDVSNRWWNSRRSRIKDADNTSFTTSPTPASAAALTSSSSTTAASGRGTHVGVNCPHAPGKGLEYPDWDYYDSASGDDIDERLTLNAHEQYLERVIVLAVFLCGLVLIVCLIFCMCYNSRFRRYLPHWLVRYRSVDYLAGLGLHMISESEIVTNTYTIPAISVHRPMEEVQVQGMNSAATDVEFKFIDDDVPLDGVLSAGRPVASALLKVPGLMIDTSNTQPSNMIPSSPSTSENSAETTLSVGTLQVPQKNNVNRTPNSRGSSLESTPNVSMTSLTSEISVFEDAPLAESLTDLGLVVNNLEKNNSDSNIV